MCYNNSMNILGIIAEFNPLHTGHEYLIEHLRRETGAEFCVVAMSGDYVQRGEPAFFSKSLRTQAALLSGADLVLELPLSAATGSAEYFAEGAVSLLEGLGCVTHLGFGSESGNIGSFQLAGKLLAEEPEDYRRLLQKNMKAGMNFPKARYEALWACLSAQETETFGDSPAPPDECSFDGQTFVFGDSADTSALLPLLKTPNNILGTEYCKALHRLHSSMVPVTVKRLGAGYHESLDDAQAGYASASGLREAFLHMPASEDAEALLRDYVPEPCRSLYRDALRQKQFVTFDDFFLPLYYTLQYSDVENLSLCQDVTPEFSEKLLHVFRQCSSVTELRTVLKSKNLTSTRVNRSLLHILLHLTKDAAAAEKEQGGALYARIRGFRREAAPLLSQIKQQASIPLVSKLADASGYLPPVALSQLERTVKASELYRAVLPGAKPESEYSQNIIVL